MHLILRRFVREIDQREVLVVLDGIGTVDRAETTARLELLGDRVTQERTLFTPEVQEQTVGGVTCFRHKDRARWRPLLSGELPGVQR